MVMTARLAFTSNLRSSKTQSKSAVEEEAHETYQRALKLLQDPILPVRAHGLLLLRQLVSPRSAGNSDKKPYVDVALAPSIISIFMQAIQDDDSYMFLNAVQGLAAMVDTFGKDVLKGLVTEYSSHLDGLAGTNLTQNDTEKRIRVGEALGQVIRRCGEALSIYGNHSISCSFVADLIFGFSGFSSSTTYPCFQVITYTNRSAHFSTIATIRLCPYQLSCISPLHRRPL